MKKISLILLLGGAALTSLAHGQTLPEDEVANPRLAPTCAGCAGAAAALEGGSIAWEWQATLRWLNTADPATRWRFVLDKRVTPRLTVGIERGGGEHHGHKVGSSLADRLSHSDGRAWMPRATWFITPEKGDLPSAVIGFGSDRLSIPRGQAVFLTFAKNIPGTELTPFVSAKFSTYKERLAFPFGMNWQFAPQWTLQGINDGEYSHFLLSHQKGDIGVSLILARSRNLGIQTSISF